MSSFAGERADDWPDFVPMVKFAINDSASPAALGSGYTPFYADRGQHPGPGTRLHPRRPLVSRPAAAPDSASPLAGEPVADLMGRVTTEVRALLQERQDRHKAVFDAAPAGLGRALRRRRG